MEENKNLQKVIFSFNKVKKVLPAARVTFFTMWVIGNKQFLKVGPEDQQNMNPKETYHRSTKNQIIESKLREELQKYGEVKSVRVRQINMGGKAI